MTADGVNDFRGACHRKPAGEVDDTQWTNPWNVRQQPAALTQSACFRKSNGALTCFTCHEPHSGKAVDACAQRHSGVKHRTAVAGKTCGGCHMPQAKAGSG